MHKEKRSMSNKFMEGLVFGAGFSVAFIIISYTADLAISPALFNYKLKHVTIPPSIQMNHSIPSSNVGSLLPRPENKRPFHELSPEEQISSASAIALATYVKQPDGRMAAIIHEFLKKNDGITIYYKVGDEYPEMSYYPSEKNKYGDGVIVFFAGSPATMQSAMTYSGNRIHSLGDMPLELLKSKCKVPNA
jgi:hypothetical protein